MKREICFFNRTFFSVDIVKLNTTNNIKFKFKFYKIKLRDNPLILKHGYKCTFHYPNPK